MSDLVITEDREAVRHVILNRPEKRNALNLELVAATGAALRDAADDPAVRCVVLRGNGPVFSAGMDVAALAAAAGAPERLRPFRRTCLEAWNLAEEMTKPTICAIHGVCLGGALELALACDLRVLAVGRVRRPARDAARPRARPRRLVAAAAGRRRRPREGADHDRAGDRRGRRGALRAREPGRAADVSTRWRTSSSPSCSACAPIAVGLAKRLIDASARPALSTTLELEITAQEQCARSEDVREGVRAAAERRAPNFQGR